VRLKKLYKAPETISETSFEKTPSEATTSDESNYYLEKKNSLGELISSSNDSRKVGSVALTEPDTSNSFFSQLFRTKQNKKEYQITECLSEDNNAINNYSQIYLENEVVSQRPTFDQASDEITKHFDHTLQEINSIINREELGKQKDQALTVNEKIALACRDEKSVFRVEAGDSDKKGLQKVSKIEETIRRNYERNQKQRGENTDNWKRRQSSLVGCNEVVTVGSGRLPPPPTQPAPLAPSESMLSREELHFFLNAIEKMQCTSFFQVNFN